jgi:hypothetical protein
MKSAGSSEEPQVCAITELAETSEDLLPMAGSESNL